jgi:hypothetical protein
LPGRRPARLPEPALQAVDVLVLLFAIVLIRTAWVGDDAYIGFRMVDNVIHGHGLRWNTFERVQAFTNPVWTLLMCAASMVTREVFFTGLALQIAISVTTIRLVARSSRSALVGCGIVRPSTAAPRTSPLDVQVGIFRAEPAGRDANGVRGRAEAEVVADDRETHGAPGRVAIVRAQPAHERAVAVVHA